MLALNSVNLRLESGSSYAFCGTSGAGKSSGYFRLAHACSSRVAGILAILQRFYDVTSGCVLLDGTDIRKIGIQQLRGQMGFVSQEPILFEETVRWNLVVSDFGCLLSRYP